MGLYQDWEFLVEQSSQDHASQHEFWESYYALEKQAYQSILLQKQDVLQGTVSELAEKLGLETVLIAGFVSGINTSLKNQVDVEAMQEDTALTLEIVWEKLLFNMHDAKAPWLYGLDEWENIFSEEKRKEIANEWRKSKVAVAQNKPGRNDPCPCGSGKKYKFCCEHAE